MRKSLANYAGMALIIVAAFGSNSWAQTEQVLYNFAGSSDGGNPLSTLTMDVAGNLYGTTFVGGPSGAGEVYELSPAAGGKWTETVLYSFTGGIDGANPYFTDVIFDQTGNLYGTTVGGGVFGLGTVFELSPSAGGTWTESVLYSFSGGRDGANPYSGLTFDMVGNLYGTTWSGGVSSFGTVFQLTPASGGQWSETVIHTFRGKDGVAPVGGLTIDLSGNVFGTTQGGGTLEAGTVFELLPSSSGIWTEKILHNFTGGADGSEPYAERLVFDAAGNLYGTTIGGGAFQLGLVFSLSPNPTGWREKVLYSFEGKVAENPWTGLVLDAKGNLYGTCANGNGETTVGAVFELSPAAGGRWTERNLHLFTRQDGEFPEAGLFRDSSGNLYGTTLLGGTDNMGVVFEVKP